MEELTRPFCLWPAGKSMVSEPKDEVQKTEAGGRRLRFATKEKKGRTILTGGESPPSRRVPRK